MAERLDHPNILRIFNYGEFEGRPYVAMELIEGSSFADIIHARRPLTLQSAVAVVAQIGDAVQYAHKRGVIHGDIKPANILVSDSGRALLADFGVATASGTSTRTPAGSIRGTPRYMSPEQAMGLPLDGRSDIYSLAMVLYEALSDLAWLSSSDGSAAILKRIVDEVPPPPRMENSHEAELIAPVLAKALAKNPDDRYQTADEFVRDLRSTVRTWVDELGDHETILSSLPKAPQSPAGIRPFTAGRLDASGTADRSSRDQPVAASRPSGGTSRVGLGDGAELGAGRVRLWAAAATVVLLSALIIFGRSWRSDAAILAVTPLVVGLLVAWWLFHRRSNEVSAAAEFSLSRTAHDGASATSAAAHEFRLRTTTLSAPRQNGRGLASDLTADVVAYQPPEVAAGLSLRDPAVGSWLLVVDGPLSGRQFNLRDALTIGRSPDNAVQLPDTRISRRQSEIVLRDDRFFIRDLGSRLGTLVNGAKVQERELRDRDEIQVGSTTLMFISAVGNAERSGNVESKRRQDEFNTIWQELTRSAHGN
jgi:hypothetical protein